MWHTITIDTMATRGWKRPAILQGFLKRQRNPRFSVSLEKHHQSVPDSRVSNEASELEPEAAEPINCDDYIDEMRYETL